MSENSTTTSPPVPVSKPSQSSPVRIIILALGLAGFLVCLRLFVLVPFKVPTGGMQPTIMGNQKLANGTVKSGDHLLIEKLSYLFGKPARGDIVVFRTKGINHPHVPQDQVYIKRVVGIPGDRIRIDPPYVLVNGSPLTNPPIFQKISSATNGYSGYRSEETPFAANQDLQLGSDEYFVAGDNTRSSLDSRYYGPIRRKQIFGRACFIYFPPARAGVPE